MQQRKLGQQGLNVSALGLGCMGLSDFYAASQVDESSAIALIHQAIDAGVNFLDTADIYGPFTNETLVGKESKRGASKASAGREKAATGAA